MGVLLPQLFYYQMYYPGDNRRLKALVYGLAILEALQTCMVTADAFHWFVFGYGDLARLDHTFLNSWDVPLLDAIIALAVQAFYCWRIHVLRRGAIVLPGFITLVSLAQCGAGIAVAVQAHQLGKLSLIGHNVVPQAVWLSGSVLADILITASLAWTLLRTHPRPSSGPSRQLVNRVVALTVETNVLTAGVAIVALVVFLAVPAHSALVVPPTAVMGKLYTNCLVAVLNLRRRRDPPSGRDSPIHMSSIAKEGWRLSRTGSGVICVSVVHDVETQWEEPKPARESAYDYQPMPRKLEPLRPKSWKYSTPSVPASWAVQRPESVYDARDRP
ncbi:hypothetical protein BD626DRAFT_395691 [Schizophyllum amplum]|uniref:DUF6534 domain-containing protein n=1 Tax=Schizophyllum amplum TaxID=97359 RepID=A0A550CVC5_9AGAR|nr:hypothetical protein BD626DRAFT_395691 [Auriculariopsis ampla]